MTGEYGALQAAWDQVQRQTGEGRAADEAAVDALWEHTRHIVCAGLQHPGRPTRRLARWATRVWRCPRCGTLQVTTRAYAGYGEHTWVWADVDSVRA